MMTPANGADDTSPVRQARVEAYAVLGQPPSPGLEELAALAAQICDVPSASINLHTDDEHQVARVGSEPGGDVAAWPFEEATDLVTPDGTVVGVLRVSDTASRTLTALQRGALRTLADRVVDVLELGLCSRLLEQALTDLATAREKLRHSTEQISDFADRISHDLRNPLTSVSMSLQMLEEQPSVVADQDAAWMVSRALRGTQRMNRLIEELLAAAKAAGTGPGAS